MLQIIQKFVLNWQQKKSILAIAFLRQLVSILSTRVYDYEMCKKAQEQYSSTKFENMIGLNCFVIDRPEYKEHWLLEGQWNLFWCMELSSICQPKDQTPSV